MRQYIIKRMGLFIPTIILITIIVFVVMRLIPGDVCLAILSDGEATFTQEELIDCRIELDLNKPLYSQYFDWIWGVLQGDFGDSYWFKAPVMEELADRIPVTVELTIMAMLISVVVAVPLGIISALRPESPLDYAARVFTMTGIAMPTFLIAILLLLLLVNVKNGDGEAFLVAPLNYSHLWDNPGTNLHQIIWPALALGFYEMGFVARVTRSAMMEIIREDYMRTARSKGLSENAVVYGHGLKNALLPVLTTSGWIFARLFGGTVIIETIFLVPGMGRILIESIFQRDYTMIQAVIVIVATFIVTINLIVDLLYGWLDPRIRYA